MTESSEERAQAGVERRAFLRRGGLVAGGAALGTAMAASSAGAQVSAQAVDFVYIPVGPTRTYDSRNPGAGGPLGLGGVRTLFTGLQTVDPPPLAITINLTVTATVGAGWLAVFPGNISFPGTSSINWFGPNQDLANNAFVEIPLDGDANDGTIKVAAGGIAGSRAQFIIDFIGASVGIDFSAVAASDARAQVRSTLSQAPAWTDS